MGYSLEQFSTECRRILEQDPGVEGRKQMCALVQRVLKGDDFVKTHLGDDPHDHGPSWAIYGQACGETGWVDRSCRARAQAVAVAGGGAAGGGASGDAAAPSGAMELPHHGPRRRDLAGQRAAPVGGQ